MMARKTAMLMATLLLALPAASTGGTNKRMAREAEALSKALEGRDAGKPVSCLETRHAQGTEVVGENILFEMNRSLTYRNETRGRCGGRDDILVFRQFGARACRGDIVTTIDRTSGFFTGNCSLGEFVPYRKPKAG